MNEYLIAGGGLAGLTLAYFLAEAGHEVLVVESKGYPRQRVCGEYVSLESLPILERIGIPVPADAPFISETQVWAAGRSKPVKSHVPLGAVGLSRFFLDNALYQACQRIGVRFLVNTRVMAVEKKENAYQVRTHEASFAARHFFNATGKQPGLDNLARQGKVKYLASKFHLVDDRADPVVSLFQYPGGYLGTSMVEGGMRCVCFLVRQDIVERSKSLVAVEDQMMGANPVLKALLPVASERLRPVVISNFNFGTTGVQHGIGDSRYLIPPLTGNGMSLAIRDGYWNAMNALGKKKAPHRLNPAAELIQKAAESNWFGLLHSVMGNRHIMGQVVENTFGPII